MGATPINITQTTDGYIWIATESGIFRFDGLRFTLWSPLGTEELRSINATTVLGTSDGSLWVSTNTGGLFQWQNEKLTKYVVPDTFLIGIIVEKEKGKVWFTRFGPRDGYKPVCEAGDGKVQCYDLQMGSENGCCASLAIGTNGDIWLGGMALIRWRPPSLGTTVVPIPGIVPNMDNVAGVAPLPDGSAWIGIGKPGRFGGLQHYGKDGWSHFHSASWDSSSVAMANVLYDSHGALWAGSRRGLYRIWKGKVDHFGIEDGLSDDRVMSLFEDHEGNLWVTTEEGIDCFRSLAVTTYSLHKGLRSEEVATVLARRDGTVLTGGEWSLDQLGEGEHALSIREKDLPGEQVTSLLEDTQGHLLVGVDQTLSVLNGKTFTEIKRPNGRSLGMVVGITEDRAKNIWGEVKGNPRALVEIRNFRVTHIFPAPNMPAAREVTADDHGDLWLGLMDGGLARYRPGKLDIARFTDRRDLRVNEVGVESDGTVLGATGYGLIGWRDGTQRILTKRDGLPCDEINAFVRDHQGALWLYAQCGLIQVSAEEFEKWWKHPTVSPKLRMFDSIDGVRPGLGYFQKSARTPDGKLWFANGQVLQMIDPLHLPINDLPPPIHVEAIIVGGKSFAPQLVQHLASSTRDISIRYTALSYVAPQKVFFRYMLEGQDKAWQEAGTRREAFYTNLRPAKYRFHVIACNNDGLWNDVGDSFTFTISPAYYQTTWFKILCAIALGGVFWSLYLFRLEQVTSQIQGQLGARLEERERIARELHDTLLQGFQGLMLRFQAVMKMLPAEQPAHQMMERVLDRADEVLLEGRQSVRDLREKGTSGTELSDALLHCGEELALGHSSRFSLAVVGDPRSVGPVVFGEAYRIIREALINAFQHSKATHIEADVNYSASGVCIRVRDDGSGVDANILARGREGHWGFSGMRERADKIGARLNIWSSSGAGTEIELTIPGQVAYSGQKIQTHWHRAKRAVSQREETKS